jgi:hypothetical protein
LQTFAKPDLAGISYFDVYAFCGGRGWPKTRGLFDRWRAAHFTTPSGQKDLERIADYLRKSDLEQFDGALEDWKDFGFKSTERLIAALEQIADSPTRGNYHNDETVEAATIFLTELRRRAGQVVVGQVAAQVAERITEQVQAAQVAGEVAP